MYIEREIEKHIQKLAGFYPIVTIIGPRQSGKTTLIRHLFPSHSYQNLETGDARDFAMADPKAFCALAPRATNPLVVYSGATAPNVVAHYADTESWLGDQMP